MKFIGVLSQFSYEAKNLNFSKSGEKMSERLEKLKLIYENVDENMRDLIFPLLQHADDWECRIELYKSKLDEIPLSKAGKEAYLFYYRLLKEAEQQYINVMKVLVSALRKNAVEEEDDFDEFLKEYTK